MITSVTDESQVGEARRRATAFAAAHGFGESRAGEVALATTEMATNLIKHAGGGTIAFGRFDDADGTGIELLSMDEGPGMASVPRCIEDGYSTAGSQGNGLGAILRLAHPVDIFSRPGMGTVVLARFADAGSAPAPRKPQIGAIITPYPGETVSGDRIEIADAAGTPSILAVDGLGHGPEAAKAAAAAAEAFKAHAARDCTALAELIHRALAATRGAALAVARMEAASGVLRFVGVGNIAGAVVSGGGARHLVSGNGTAGHLSPRIREYTYPLPPGALLVLHSDGLTAKWDLHAYPGLAACHPSVIAGVLLRDFRRGKDDRSVLVLRVPP